MSELQQPTSADLKQKIARPADLRRDSVVARVVVAQNLVEADVVQDLLRRQILDGLRTLIGWESGAVTFQRTRTGVEPPTLVIDTRWALLEVMRQRDEEGDR